MFGRIRLYDATNLIQFVSEILLQAFRALSLEIQETFLNC